MIVGPRPIDSISITLAAALAFALVAGCAGQGGGSSGSAGSGGSTGRAGTGGTTASGAAGSGAGAAGSGGAGAGTTGVAGTTGGGAGGGAGSKGAAGSTGNGGSAGGAGTSGHAGTAGGAGTTGSAGTAGNAGTNGGAGSSGAAGATGGAVGDPCSARPGLVFCDTFEGATTTTPPAPWTTTGTVTVDSTTPAHSGKKSIHIGDTTSDYDTLLILHDAAVLPQPAGRFYVRVFMQISMPMSAQHNTFILSDLFAAQGSGNALRVGEDDNMLMFTLAGDTHAALSNASYYSDGMMPGIQFTPGAWTCLELLLDSQAPEIDVWVNTHEVPDLHHTDFPIDDYDNLRFGFEKYAGPAMDIWYDDIAVGTQPIGCD